MSKLMLRIVLFDVAWLTKYDDFHVVATTTEFTAENRCFRFGRMLIGRLYGGALAF